MEPSIEHSVAVTLCAVALTAWLAIGPGAPPAVAAAPSQLTFASPDDATAALLDAMKQDDQKRLVAVLGPGSEARINSGDQHADATYRQKFVDNYQAQHKLAEVNPGHDVLDIGVNDWPLPFPLMQVNGRWQFDSPPAPRRPSIAAWVVTRSPRSAWR